MFELEKVYDPRAVEPEIFARWEQSGAFRSHPGDTPHDRTFTIVMPPPNVTGALHLGHALNNTLQDILVRYHRMCGFNTLWQPGTDHAGIATQAVVERRILQQEGKTRHDLGRDELVRRIWQWKDEYERRITSQLKLLGCSADWERSRFTLDDGLAKAVRHQFFKMFKDGLIFRGKRLVNWDTQLQTAVSDDEVYHETVKGHFWHFRYPVIDPKPGEPQHVIIATTRPETMLGDTAVAVHPDPAGFFDQQESKLRDALLKCSAKERAEIESKLAALADRRATHLDHLITLSRMANDGRKLRLPLVERIIPLITDEWADPTLGSGCVKITPAHDPNDYQVGVRKNLPMINVLTPDGKIAKIMEPDPAAAPVKPGSSENIHNDIYAGLEFSTQARAKVVADMESRGLIETIEDRETEIGHSDRSKTPIEPFLSDQWFVRTGDGEPLQLGDGSYATGLAQAAMDVVSNEDIEFFPARYAKTYLDWLGEKRDWCISRQLWWGHRIHDWYIVWEGPYSDYTSDSQTVRMDLDYLTPEQRSNLAPQVFPGRLGNRILVGFAVAPAHPDIETALIAHDATQDPDVLDTWFSSALWPFSTLGWPEETPHLKQYYPGTVLVTSRDIITNWVARMVMFGLYTMGKVPFDRVYITPKVLDGRGETMSKSKGNGVDPVDVIHIYGADALRYSMADMATETQDIRMPIEYLCPHCGHLTEQSLALKNEEQSRKSRGEKLERKLQPADCLRVRCTHKECATEFATQWADDTLKKELGLAREVSDKFEIGRNFCNKLWNAARFAFRYIENAPCDRLAVSDLLPEDRWILARLSETSRRIHGFMANYQFSAIVKELRDFFWDGLCDWYIELTKPRLSGEAASTSTHSAEASKRHACQVLAFCLDQSLRLWHPIMPFITERLWQQLNGIVPNRGMPGVVEIQTNCDLISAPMPPTDGYPAFDDPTILTTFSQLQEATRAVRDLRLKGNIVPKQMVDVTVILSDTDLKSFRANAHILRTTAGIASLTITSSGKRPVNSASLAIHGLRVYVHDIGDDVMERERTTKSLADIEKQIVGKQGKLNNPGFISGAKADVVAAERERLDQLQQQLASLRIQLGELGG
ncbi:MAG: valine--tRNA ligase [Planctomycetota bacterium]